MKVSVFDYVFQLNAPPPPHKCDHDFLQVEIKPSKPVKYSGKKNNSETKTPQFISIKMCSCIAETTLTNF